MIGPKRIGLEAEHWQARATAAEAEVMELKSQHSLELFDATAHGELQTLKALSRAEAAEARIEVLEKALRWYQDQVSKCNRLTDTTARNALARDLGKRAAAALKGSTNG